MPAKTLKPAATTFPGAMAALQWLEAEGYKAPDGVMSGRFVKEGDTAYVVDDRGGTVVVAGGPGTTLHAPADCAQSGQGSYSFKNWIFTYACPTCHAKRRQNKNFLGADTLVCLGEGRFRRRRG